MNVMRGDLLDTNGAPAEGLSEPRREIMRLLRMLRRNWILIGAAALLALVLGFAFIALVDPTYRSTVRILLDQSRAGDVTEAASLPQGNNVDEYIATQVAIFQSDVIVRRVAEELGIDDDANLVRLPEGALPVSYADEAAAEIAMKPVFDALRRTISVYRLDRSFVVEVAANSPDPALSRHVADAVGSAYIADQSESYSQSLTQAGDWLEERIEDLRRQSLEAAEAVEAFRTQSGIRATEGQLISDQQLTGLSNQFVLAEANVARLQSRHDTFRTAIEANDLTTLAGLLSGTGAGESGAPSVAAADYLNVLERERAVADGFGADNSQLPAIRAEAERLGRLVLVESRSRLASYSNELEAARAQLSGLEQSMQLAATRSETSNLPLVQLRSLEQRANSLQTLYQTYLQRYQETLQRQSLPVNAARIISYAEEPGRPVFPNTKIVLAFALVAGLGLGTALAIGREFFDGSIRTADDLKRLGLEPIGYASRVRGVRPGTAVEADLMRLRRSLLSALRPTRGPSFVAFVSALPGEGRSFMTDLLAAALLEEGRKVAVVDLSGSPLPAEGRERGRWLPFALPLPFFARRSPERARGALRTADVKRVAGSFSDLRTITTEPDSWNGLGDLASYDFVLVDLPPLETGAELRTVAGAVDTLVILAEWGRTEADTLRDMLASGPVFQRKVAGAVLTKVNRRKRALYEARRVGAAR